jgi:hypothetical protein
VATQTNQALGPVSPKDYTGRFVVAHPIQAGQTLDLMANIYRFKHWKPIWLYNTKIVKTIGDDPNLIRKGITILIPRSENGYNILIRKLEASKEALESSVEQEAIRQEGIAFEREASAVKWNLAGDVLTLGASLGVKFLRAAKAARVAKSVVGQAKIAAQLAANSETRQWAQACSAARSQLTGQALAANKAARVEKAAVRTFVRDKAIDAATKVADEVRNRETGDDKSNAFKNSKNTALAVNLSREAWEGVVTAGEFSVEAIGIALDYVEVATVSDWLVYLFKTGQTFAQVQHQVMDNAKRQAAAMSAFFDDKIDKLTSECDLLYG